MCKRCQLSCDLFCNFLYEKMLKIFFSFIVPADEFRNMRLKSKDNFPTPMTTHTNLLIIFHSELVDVGLLWQCSDFYDEAGIKFSLTAPAIIYPC